MFWSSSLSLKIVLIVKLDKADGRGVIDRGTILLPIKLHALEQLLPTLFRWSNGTLDKSFKKCYDQF